MENSIVISVNTIPERDAMIKDLYETLRKNPNKQFIIVQDRVNRIKIFHNKKNLKMLIKTYIVVVLPVLIDFSPLDSIYGTVDFQLHATVDRLVKLTHKLQSLQGKRFVEGKIGAEKLRKALTQIF